MLISVKHPGQRSRSLLRLHVYCFALICTISSFVSAQLVNGQFFTNGLAITNSPAPHSQNIAGENLNIAVELSGDGRLPQGAFLPTSNSESAYESLSIFLVSAETNVNFTVTVGSQFLQQEPGSTVKHLAWPIPVCALSGNYNLTFYELSRINGFSFYSITPMPIVIKSQSTSTSPCSNSVIPSPQPQDSSPPPRQPWLPPGFTLTHPLSTSGFFPTISKTGLGTATLNPQSPTVTVTLLPSPTTVTFVSTLTVQTTISGSTTVFTTLTTGVSVSTAGSSGAFLPVNSAISSSGSVSVILICVCILFIS